MRTIGECVDGAGRGRIEAPIVADGRRYCRRCLLDEEDLGTTSPLTDRSTTEVPAERLQPRYRSVETVPVAGWECTRHDIRLPAEHRRLVDAGPAFRDGRWIGALLQTDCGIRMTVAVPVRALRDREVLSG